MTLELHCLQRVHVALGISSSWLHDTSMATEPQRYRVKFVEPATIARRSETIFSKKLQQCWSTLTGTYN